MTHSIFWFSFQRNLTNSTSSISTISMICLNLKLWTLWRQPALERKYGMCELTFDCMLHPLPQSSPSLKSQSIHLTKPLPHSQTGSSFIVSCFIFFSFCTYIPPQSCAYFLEAVLHACPSWNIISVCGWLLASIPASHLGNFDGRWWCPSTSLTILNNCTFG